MNSLRGLHFRLWSSFGRAQSSAHDRTLAAVILKVDRIGDFVLALSAIRSLTRHFGEGDCALVVANGVAELARLEFPRAKVVELPAFVRQKRAWPHWWRARARLSALACEHLVCLRHQRWDYDELMLRWPRAKAVHALRDPRAEKWVQGRRSFWARDADWREPACAGKLCRELLLHREVVARATGLRLAADEMLPRFVEARTPEPSREGVIAPFSSAFIKDIPETLLLSLARERPLAAMERVVLLGSAEQRGRLETLAGKLRVRGCAHVGVETPSTLVGFINRVGGAGWVLSADTAAAHVAVAWDLPTVVLLGGGHHGQFAPWSRSPRQRWLSHVVPCYDCGWVCSQTEPLCLTQITPAQVAAAMAEVVAR